MRVKRETNLYVAGTAIPLPCFFPSISSVKTNLNPVDYLKVLTTVEYPHILISAYDIYHSSEDQREEISTMLQTANERGTIVFVDSGNYESYWKEDEEWSEDQLATILETESYHLAFYLDDHNPPSSVEDIIRIVEQGVLRDQKCASEGTVLPILHAPVELLPEAALGIIERLNPMLLAVPERELGEGITSRAETIVRIRKALNQSGYYCPLHLLGTGNPLSILIYSLCGADSFDALEWCQTSVDHETGLLYHFQQREFFGNQSPFCTMPNASYTLATLGHNLLFYRGWMEKISEAIKAKSHIDIIRQYLPKPVEDALTERLPEVFQC